MTQLTQNQRDQIAYIMEAIQESLAYFTHRDELYAIEHNGQVVPSALTNKLRKARLDFENLVKSING